MAVSAALTLEARIARHVLALATLAPGRPPGSPANSHANDYLERALRAAGASPVAQAFRARWWRPGSARLAIDGVSFAIDPPPFCRSTRARGVAAIATTASDLEDGHVAPGAAIVLRDELASSPYFPKAFPFVSDPEQRAVIAALEALEPACVVAVATTPGEGEPVFEDPDLAFPYAAVGRSIGARLTAGSELALSVTSSINHGAGVNIAGGTTTGRRALVCAHMDSKVTTPGILDNAAGVAALLAFVEAGLGELGPVEVVFFNGEDHYAAPGEQAWLAERNLADIALVVNVDGAGLRGRRSAVSTLGAPPKIDARVAAAARDLDHLESGPPWFESDHAIFAMRGIPTIAVTSGGDLAELRRIAHSPDETVERVDPNVLADVVRFLQRILAAPTIA